MDPLSLNRLHLSLECKGIDAANRVYRIPGPDPDPIHRVYVIRHAQGETFFFSADLQEKLRRKLLRIPARDYFDAPERIKAALAEGGLCEGMHIGRSYFFPPEISPRDFLGVTPVSRLDPEVVGRYDRGLRDSGKEAFAILVDGEIVSTCESSRENEQAGEAWVRTLEGFRRRGFARRVTAAWGYWLMQQGKVPFYSHVWENQASRAVAQSLGLVQYIEDAGYE